MVTVLTREGIFDAAIMYFHKVSLAPRPKALKEGISECHHASNQKNIGTIWVYNGDLVQENALEQEIIVKREKGIVETQAVPYLEDLVDYVAREEDEDHVYLINTSKKKASKVKGGLRNYDRNVDISTLENQLPDNFLSRDCSVPKNKVGSRTDAAMLSAYLMNLPPCSDDSEVRVIAIKETKYSNTKLGKLTEFGPGGYLHREVFFEKRPHHNGPYFHEKKNLVGIYREYEPKEGKAELKSESYVSLSPDGGITYTPLHQKSPNHSNISRWTYTSL
ncbi:hypothetical protein HZC32_00950 [Candidatus Woesearchaeota archaeon]|nr:hypothetical protein [Candidatus Woesearchaeota archaeon]